VPGQRHPHDLIRRVEPGEHLLPRPGPLREAVEQHDPPSIPPFHRDIDLDHGSDAAMDGPLRPESEPDPRAPFEVRAAQPSPDRPSLSRLTAHVAVERGSHRAITGACGGGRVLSTVRNGRTAWG
jgi:hypothetical protein